MNQSIKEIKDLGFPWVTSDPFIFCVHHLDNYPKGNGKMGPAASLEGRYIGQDFAGKDGWNMYHGKNTPGFPAHPHCGFETVTVVLQGLVDHTDSLGAAGRFGDGDAQWMTAGKGVQHAEMFPLKNEEDTNVLELFQIWLNLPRRSKKVDPHFLMLWGESIPKYKHVDVAGLSTAINVVAGEIDGHRAPAPPPDSWAADPENELAIWTIEMDPNATWTIPASKGKVNRTIYFFKGDHLNVDGQRVEPYKAVEVESRMDLVLENGSEQGRILVLQGRPIEEPIVQQGPFVVNYPGEIREVMLEFHSTQFGGWPWPAHDHTHDKERGKFALHANGTLEVPPAVEQK